MLTETRLPTKDPKLASGDLPLVVVFINNAYLNLTYSSSLRSTTGHLVLWVHLGRI